MIRLLTFFLLILLASSLFGQTITLNQKRSPSDLKVTNGSYNLYFNKKEIIKSLAQIEKVTNQDHKTLMEFINNNDLQPLDLQGNSTGQFLVELLKSNLGSYLVSRGLVSIDRNGRLINVIVADESPEMVNLDGSSNVSILFFEKGKEEPIFIGDLNTKLKIPRSKS
jgi:hypothetical protein